MCEIDILCFCYKYVYGWFTILLEFSTPQSVAETVVGLKQTHKTYVFYDFIVKFKTKSHFLCCNVG